VDLGANIGYFSLLAARLVGREGKVYAFEPEPRNFGLLLKNIELNGYNNIVAVQKAVSNISGSISLFLHVKDTGAHTIYQPEHAEKEFGECIEVQTVTVDEFFEDKEQRIDVIKMDIEGAEMAALLGMDRVIRENENLKMFIEFHPPGIRRRGDSLEGFARRLLEDYDFSIMAIGDYTMRKEYLKINTVKELVDFCKGGKTVNLFVEKVRK
jgi:FkbM family methyltransferase